MMYATWWNDLAYLRGIEFALKIIIVISSVLLLVFGYRISGVQKQQALPRTLSSDQRGMLINALSPRKGIEVGFYFPSGDRESLNYAREIANVFAEAGWISEGPNPDDFMKLIGQTEGITLLIPEKFLKPEEASFVQTALQSAGIESTFRTFPTMNEGKWLFLVSYKTQ